MTTDNWITKCRCIFEMRVEMNGLRVRGFNAGTRKVIPDGISWGILSSRGPSTPGCSVWPPMKEMQLSFGISDDWLPGSCVAWNGLLCTSRSSLPILIPSHKSPSCRQAHRLWLSLLAKTHQTEVQQTLWVISSSTYNPKRHPCSPTLILSPKLKERSSSITKATWRQGMSGCWHMRSLKGLRLLSFEKGMEWTSDKSPSGASPLTSTGQTELAKKTPRILFLALSFSVFSSRLLLITLLENTSAIYDESLEGHGVGGNQDNWVRGWH